MKPLKIKPLLARLQNAIGSQEIAEKMVLLPEPTAPPAIEDASKQGFNLVVGYNSSPKSQTALDIALLIAHQTRLATQKQVTVHVVYVLDGRQSSLYSSCDRFTKVNNLSFVGSQIKFSAACAVRSTATALASPNAEALTTSLGLTPIEWLEQADRILWQARCLAEEWKGTFIAHLRFGCLSNELQQIVETEAADLLLLGCDSPDHPIIQQLDTNFPCAVLGIPTVIE